MGADAQLSNRRLTMKDRLTLGFAAGRTAGSCGEGLTAKCWQLIEDRHPYPAMEPKESTLIN
jgi:hypothetical protein